MAKMQIWHNPRCSKSRQGLSYLKEQECDVKILDYLKENIDADELAGIIEMSGEPLENFIRTNEKEYKELGLKDKNLTAIEFAKIVSKHPKLLQRPIVIKDGKAVVARPLSRIDELL